MLTSTFSSTDSLWHWPGVHNLHGSHQPVPWRAVLVRPLLPDAVHSRDRLPIRNPGGSGDIYRGYEVIPEFEKGVFNRGSLPPLLSPVYGFCSWFWQLHLLAFRYVQRELPSAHHCVLRVRRDCLRVWS